MTDETPPQSQEPITPLPRELKALAERKAVLVAHFTTDRSSVPLGSLFGWERGEDEDHLDLDCVNPAFPGRRVTTSAHRAYEAEFNKGYVFATDPEFIEWHEVEFKLEPNREPARMKVDPVFKVDEHVQTPVTVEEANVRGIRPLATRPSNPFDRLVGTFEEVSRTPSSDRLIDDAHMIRKDTVDYKLTFDPEVVDALREDAQALRELGVPEELAQMRYATTPAEVPPIVLERAKKAYEEERAHRGYPHVPWDEATGQTKMDWCRGATGSIRAESLRARQSLRAAEQAVSRLPMPLRQALLSSMQAAVHTDTAMRQLSDDLREAETQNANAGVSVKRRGLLKNYVDDAETNARALEKALTFGTRFATGTAEDFIAYVASIAGEPEDNSGLKGLIVLLDRIADRLIAIRNKQAIEGRSKRAFEGLRQAYSSVCSARASIVIARVAINEALDAEDDRENYGDDLSSPLSNDPDNRRNSNDD